MSLSSLSLWSAEGGLLFFSLTNTKNTNSKKILRLRYDKFIARKYVKNKGGPACTLNSFKTNNYLGILSTGDEIYYEQPELKYEKEMY